MKARCRDKSYPSFHRYGGRGIQVCDDWKNNFVAFYDWARNGYSDDLEIDRINNNGNYEPSNCRCHENKSQIENKQSWNIRKLLA